jgi:hypothetical protein
VRSALSAHGRRVWMLAASVAGIAGACIAAWQREYGMAVVIVVTLAVLLGVYLWGSGSEE